MVELDGLKRLTQELAEEVEYEEVGPVLKFTELILKSIKSPAAIISKDYRVIYLNPTAKKLAKKFGITIDYSKKCYEMQHGYNKPCEFCPSNRVLKTKKIENVEWISPNSDVKYMVTSIPLVYNGISGFIEIMNPMNRVNNNAR